MPCTLWWAWHCRRRRSNSCLVSTWPVSRMTGKLRPKYSILYLYQLLKKCCCRELGGTKTNVSSHGWELQQWFWQGVTTTLGDKALRFHRGCPQSLIDSAQCPFLSSWTSSAWCWWWWDPSNWWRGLRALVCSTHWLLWSVEWTPSINISGLMELYPVDAVPLAMISSLCYSG